MFRQCNTVKLGRAWRNRPWKYMDPTKRPVKISKQDYQIELENAYHRGWHEALQTPSYTNEYDYK